MPHEALNGCERRALWIVALLMARFTQLPELMDHFGYDAEETLRFIDRFGGMTLKIPPRATMGMMARDIDIYTSMLAMSSKDNAKRLAGIHGITEERVFEIARETRETLARLDRETGFDSRIITRV